MAIGKTVFLTGFPGFIAVRLVERLAGENVQFFLLVQEEFVEKAIEEVEAIADRTKTPLENFALIPGDVTRKDLGIGAEDLDLIRDETTDVFHLAAVYNLAVERDLAYKVNLEGTRNVNDFVRSVKSLDRYNYISTCYVAGKREGKIREDELEHKAGFRNYYEETKYLAEMEVERLKEELPVTIFRPSVVVGDSQTGETAKYDGIYYLIHYLRKAPGLLRFINVGNSVVKLNLVPVDFVVKGIVALSEEPAAVGKTIALADPNPLTTAQLFDSITKSMTGKGSAITPPPKFVEWSLLQSFSPPVTGLPHHAVPYFFISQTYDTSVAGHLLAKHGIACQPFGSYVGNLLKFVEKHAKL